MENLREHQIPVIEAALAFLSEPLQRQNLSRFGRIVMPPRTGKTVIAATLIQYSGDSAVFLAPTQTIVEQATQTFRTLMPKTPVWTVMAGRREVGERGIVVSTYQSLQRMHESGVMARLIANAKLVFADEAHHAMTEIRQGLLRDVFPADAARIALTATPDYSEERILAEHFPELIHEMTIQEGVESGLLAKVRAYSVPIDSGKARVRVLNGEYDQEALGLVMSHAPFLKAASLVRYDPEFKDLPALITCSSRAQAMCLFEYLAEHRPEGTPCPAPILGNMDTDMRLNFLDQFDAGKLDTLITVGVLLEGWDSLRCKLLVDLAPTMSWVKAAQKYARVMTKDGDRQARIVVLQPSGLLNDPVLPLDVFGPGIEETGEELTLPAPMPPKGSGKRGKRSWERLREAGIPVISVEAEIELIENHRIDRIPIDRGNIKRVKRLLKAYKLVPPRLNGSAFGAFITTRFILDGIGFRGSQLLRKLGYAVSLAGYQAFVARYFSDEFADLILNGTNTWYYAKRFRETGNAFSDPDLTTITVAEMNESTARRFRREFYRIGASEPHKWLFRDHDWSSKKYRRVLDESLEMYDGLLAAQGGDSVATPEEPYFTKQDLLDVARNMGQLSPIESGVMRKHLGLDGEDEMTLAEIAREWNLSSTRIGQIWSGLQARLRRMGDRFGTLVTSGTYHPCHVTVGGNEGQKFRWLELPPLDRAAFKAAVEEYAKPVDNIEYKEARPLSIEHNKRGEVGGRVYLVGRRLVTPSWQMKEPFKPYIEQVRISDHHPFILDLRVEYPFVTYKTVKPVGTHGRWYWVEVRLRFDASDLSRNYVVDNAAYIHQH